MFFLEAILKIINNYFILPFDLNIKVNNFKLYANKPDRILAILLWKFGLLEKNEINFLKNVIKPNMQVLDIGANIGYYTTFLSSLVGVNGAVFAFEPEKNNFRLLSKCIKNNKILNTKIYNSAASDVDGVGNLYVSKINSGDNRLESFTQIHKKLKVSKVKLDNLIENYKSIDFIKIDIQGGEYKALLGMKSILQSSKNLIILIELDTQMIKLSNVKVSILIKFLKNYFDYTYVIKDKKICIENNIIDYLDNKNYKYENIIFSKKNLMVGK